MGGGSMNAASILSYLIKKKIVNISTNKAKDLDYKVGSDVFLGIEKKKFNFIEKWKNNSIK